MKKNTYKIMPIILAIMVIFSTICLPSTQVMAESITDYNYDIVGNSVKITLYTGNAKEITIPSIIDNLPVTTIGDNAFSGRSGLTSVTIPDSVTTIGNLAFFGCSGLTSVTIADSVTTIDYLAFFDCSGLTSVTIPDSVTTIGSEAFENCSGLTSVTIADSVTTIGKLAFLNCSGLTSVTIPDSVTTIDGGAFYSCSGLTSVTIADSVTTIGSGAFDNCSGLTSVTIPDSVTTIGRGAFMYCSGLTSVTIPDSVTTIDYGAFHNCTGLTSVTMESSGTVIGSEAFPLTPNYINSTIQNAVNSINSSTSPILDNYINASIEGVTADNITEVNAAVSSAKTVKVSNLTKKEIQEVVGIVEINKGNMTFTNYRYGGITGVIPDNLNAVNAVVSSAKTAKGSSLTKTEIQNSVNEVIAAIAAINSGSASVSDYIAAGITDVTVDNIDFIKLVILNSKSGGTNLTTRQIQCIVNKAIAAINAINSGSALFSDYNKAGITGVTVDNINAANAVVAIAKNIKCSALTKAEIQAAITDGVATVEITDKDGTLTAQLKKLNGTEFTTGSLVTYKWYRDNVVIGGENNYKYILSVNDIGKSFRLEAEEYNLTSNIITIPSNYKFQVDSVENIPNKNVANGTSKNDIGLPNTVNVTLKNSITTSAAVSWDNGSPTYDGSREGAYTFTGILSLPSGVGNTNNLKASVDVIVGESTITSVDSLPDRNVDNGTDMSSIGLPKSVEVTLNNSTTTSAAVTWDNGRPTYDGDVAGTYKFTGALSLQSGVKNPNDYKAVINVIVKAASSVIPPEPPIPPTPPVPIIPPVTEETTSAAVTIKGITRVGNTLEAVLLTGNNARFTTSAGVTYEWYRLSSKGSTSGTQVGTDKTYKLVSIDKNNYIMVVAYYNGKELGNDITGKITAKSSGSNSSNNNSSTVTETATISDLTKVVRDIIAVIGQGATAGEAKEVATIEGVKVSVTTITKAGTSAAYVIASETSNLSATIPVDGAVIAVYKYIPLLNKYIPVPGAVITANTVTLPVQANATYVASSIVLPPTETIAQGWVKVDNKWYMVNATGDILTGWVNDGKGWAYLSPINGVMQTGWVKDGSSSYYMTANGYMATGWIEIDQKWYYFNDNGSLAVDTTINGYNVDENGVWFH